MIFGAILWLTLNFGEIYCKLNLKQKVIGTKNILNIL